MRTKPRKEPECRNCGKPISNESGVFAHVREGAEFSNETASEKRRCFVFAEEHLIGETEMYILAKDFWLEYYKADPSFRPSKSACEFAAAFALERSKGGTP